MGMEFVKTLSELLQVMKSIVDSILLVHLHDDDVLPIDELLLFLQVQLICVIDVVREAILLKDDAHDLANGLLLWLDIWFGICP